MISVTLWHFFFGSKVTDMALTHLPLTYVGSRTGQVQVSDIWWPLEVWPSEVIFGPGFESDGQIKLRHLVYWAFQGQGEVTNRSEHVSDPNCEAVGIVQCDRWYIKMLQIHQEIRWRCRRAKLKNANFPEIWSLTCQNEVKYWPMLKSNMRNRKLSTESNTLLFR